jgi:DNA replication protein DnaC
MIKSSVLIEKCKALKLLAVADLLDNATAFKGMNDKPFNDQLDELLEAQLSLNNALKTKRLQRQAKLRYPNLFISDIDYSLYPVLKPRQIEQLSTCDWINKKQQVLIIGATGLGKTSLACGFAQEAIKQHISVLFYRLSHLLLELTAAQNEGKLHLFIKKINRAGLLILDDWGNALLDKDERHLFFELVESRDKHGSMLITSQYPIDIWHDTFQDATIADSVLDRIIHNSHQIHLKGDSIRKIMGLKGGSNESI